MARRRQQLEDTAPQQSVGRLERLSDAVGRMRSARGWDSDRVMLALGGVLIVGGLVAIVIGWWGAANTGLPFEQTPYMISGGLLGLALVFLGGFVYFAYWITRLMRETRSQSDRASELLDRIAEAVNGTNLNGSGPARSSGGAFVATRNGSQFHTPDCAVVAGRSGLRRVSGRERGLTACRICNPTSN